MSHNRDDISYIVNIVTIGDTAVGKTCLCNRFINEEFCEDIQPTIGADFLTKIYSIKEKFISVKFWDTAGQEKYKAIGTKFYQQAHGACLVYDVTNR